MALDIDILGMAFFYITRDIERAAGFLGIRNDYYVITYPSPLAEAIKHKFSKQIILINQVTSNKKQVTKLRVRSTLALIRSEYVQEKVHELPDKEQPNILVFKNSHQIEEECEKLNWKLLNPSAELSGKIENKISQYSWLREEKSASLEVLTPISIIGEVGQFEYEDLMRQFGKDFIMQYNIGHTGSGTKRIINEQLWKNEVVRFPKRIVKISEYIKGRMYTINACVIGDNNVVCGGTSEQITGLKELTGNQLATVGNDWNSVSEETHNKVKKIAVEIGKYMMQNGWRGLFGIDVIIDAAADRAYLIEINARQPASVSLESQLQNENDEINIMEWHVNTLCGNNAPQPPLILRGRDWRVTGSQLFFRNIENHPVSLQNEFLPGRYKADKQGHEFIEKATSVAETQKGEIFAFSVSQNEKVKPGGELLRIQSKQGIVDTFGKNYLDVMRSIRKEIQIEI
ncbi:MAG: ATP-grasp domain-containing protein [Patescibacteria group bacterium]